LKATAVEVVAEVMEAEAVVAMEEWEDTEEWVDTEVMVAGEAVVEAGEAAVDEVMDITEELELVEVEVEVVGPMAIILLIIILVTILNTITLRIIHNGITRHIYLHN
jgi:hypothetical protein